MRQTLAVVLACASPLAAQTAEFLPAAPLDHRELTTAAAATRAAVVVGADAYPGLSGPERSLPTARVTAERLREGLVAHAGFAPTAVATLLGEQVHGQEVKAAILAAAQRIGPGDDGLLLVAWAGHGWTRPLASQPDQHEQYLLTRYSKEDGSGFSDGVSVTQLVGWLSEARAEAGKRGVAIQPVLWIDACRVGRGKPPAKVKAIPLAAWQVFGAAEGQMVSVGQGSEPFLFTGALVSRLAAYAKLDKAVALETAFAPCQTATREQTKGAQVPQIVRPGDPALAAKVPALVAPRRVLLSVRCVDALAGIPIEGAALRVNDAAMAMVAGRGERMLAPGQVVLTARAEGYLGRTDELPLGEVAAGMEVTLPLMPYVAVVRGRLVPPAVATVAVAGGPTARDGLHRTEQATARDGVFELRVPALAGAELRIVQQGRVLQRFALPAEPKGFLRDRAGRHDGVPMVEIACELNDATLRALGADAPPVPVAGEPQLTEPEERFAWEQAQQAIAGKRWDLARSRLRRIQGDPQRVAALRRQVEALWATSGLEQVLSQGKGNGDWSGAAELKQWWAAKPDVEQRERIAELFAEIAREEVPLAVRKAFEAGNKAYGDGELERALAEYDKALRGANEHYGSRIEEQRKDIRFKLYRRHASVAFQAQMDGDLAKALDAYGEALMYSESAKADIEDLLNANPALAGTARGRELAARVGAKAPGALVSDATAPGGARLETGIGLTMIRVEAGESWIGSPASEAGRDGDEQRHRVRITKGYWLGETEVTQAQWRAVMGTEPWKGKSYVREGDAVAATYVSHADAREFCRKLTEREKAAGRLPEGYRYVLPTEAEWERAARAGSETAYCFGDDEGRLREFAVFADARDGDYAHPVKSRKPNAWGFYDLHGNVWEWCADFANWDGKVVTDTYREGIVDPFSKGGSQRVRRGGSWYNPAANCRSADRYCDEPGSADSLLGLRPALAARSDVE